MRKSAKIFLVLLTMSLVTIPIRTIVRAKTTIPEPTKAFYVNDFADLFTSEEEKNLVNKAVKLADETDGVQVVVTTIKSLEGENLEDYANEMYNKYKIGKDDMGILILLSTEDRKIRVEVGLSMEGYINDAKAGRLIDQYAIPDLKQNKFKEGITKLQAAFIEEISKEVKKVEVEKTPESESDFSSIVGIIGFVLLGIALIAGIYIFVMNIVQKFKVREEEIERLNWQIKRSNKEVDNLILEQTSYIGKEKNLKIQLQQLKKSYETLDDRYQRAMTIYPNLDTQIDEMIEEEIRQADMKRAKQVDEKVEGIIHLKPSKDIVGQVENIIHSYEELNSRQRQYIKSDMKKVKFLYDTSFELLKKYQKEEREKKNKKNAIQAEEAIENLILGISIGRASNYRKLKEANRIYESLDSGAKRYFNLEILSHLETLIREAKRDKEREEEEEERRRRQRQHDSYDDFGGSGGFGGFGGSSGGGGASRGF